MEVTHSAEPWDIYAQPINGAGDAILELVEQVQQTAPMANAIYLLNAGGKCPATTGCGQISEANARRIVACVNACAGIDDPANFIATVRAESAALAELLEIALDEYETTNGKTKSLPHWSHTARLALDTRARQALGETT